MKLDPAGSSHADPNGRRRLRRGWTTGACAAAAAKAAFLDLAASSRHDTVTIVLPGGEEASFRIARRESCNGGAKASVVKDAGDDPDVTHGALISTRICWRSDAPEVCFHADPGVGLVTLPGLPLAVGEPAINPVPRQMIRDAIKSCETHGGTRVGGLDVYVGVERGEQLAERTWNPRLGIRGGISILGTTGIVIPYSCSAWIHAIQRGVDVACASGHHHLGAPVGRTSEALLRRRYRMADPAIIDMGNFVGGFLRYLRRADPLPSRVTVAGGIAKILKLAQGATDLHHARSQVDFAALAQSLAQDGAPMDLIRATQVARTVFELHRPESCRTFPLGDWIARKALSVARGVLATPAVELEVLICDRWGKLIGSAPN